MRPAGLLRYLIKPDSLDVAEQRTFSTIYGTMALYRAVKPDS